jgi:hypothetical protein
MRDIIKSECNPYSFNLHAHVKYKEGSVINDADIVGMIPKIIINRLTTDAAMK